MTIRRDHLHRAIVTMASLALFLAIVPPVGPATGVASQAAPRIAYPRPGAIIPGPDVALAVVGGPVDVGGFQVVLDGQPILDAAPSPVVLRGLLPGDHVVSLVANDGSVVLETTFTSLPEATGALREGICDATKPEAVADLGILSTTPDPGAAARDAREPLSAVGVPLAVPVAFSTTTVPVSLEDILGRAHAITIEIPGEGEADPSALLCGAIGGSTLDGVLRIGLGPVGEVLAYGIATLVADGDETTITVELVQTDAAPQTLTGIDPLPGDSGPLPSGVRQGVCSGLATAVSFDLEDLSGVAEEDRDELPTGVPLAIPAISSQTTISATLADLLTRAFSLQASAIGLPDIADETLVACGEVGGVPVGETLRVALLAANISGFVGTATLTGSEEGTDVLITVVRGGLASEEPADVVEPESEPAVVEDPTGGPVDEPAIPEEPVIPEEPRVPEEPVTPEEPPFEPEPTFDPGPAPTAPPPPAPTDPPPPPTIEPPPPVAT
ncbi:MAG: hypothetical protein WKF80_05090, partial [Thermomicrobiales bacterium]